MIQSIRVHGFRSLLDFDVNLTKGLNVLVGPNGTGKSNFISFLDFIGTFLQSGLNSAIAVAQGSGSVFSKELFEENYATLSFRIVGSLDTSQLPNYFYLEQKDRGNLSYDYYCEITYVKDLPAVYVSKETITLSLNGKELLGAERKTSIQDREFKSTVELSRSSQKTLRSGFSWIRPSGSQDFNVSEYLAKSVRQDASIFRIIVSGYQLAALAVLDMSGYRSINIDPVVARKPTSVGSSSRLQPNGEGLSGALYQLEQGTYQHNSLFFYRPPDPASVQKEKFESIMSWCREVNPDIARVSVDLDFQEAELKPFMSFEFRDGIESFPLSRISDGTVKWLTLLCVLYMNEDLSVIEEPENFLHPFMQETFVGLCRHLIGSSNRFVIVSTHSPTLLDRCDPSEVILFETHKGHTVASRVSNAEELRKKISNSRFGLGYYYRTGGLYGTDRSPS